MLNEELREMFFSAFFILHSEFGILACKLVDIK